MKIKICKYCIQPDTRPNVYFNEEGICGACLWEKEKKTIDWDNFFEELIFAETLNDFKIL